MYKGINLYTSTLFLTQIRTNSFSLEILPLVEHTVQICIIFSIQQQKNILWLYNDK